MGHKYALLIGNGEYADSSFHPLVKAAADVNNLHEVLKDPELGQFDEVMPLINVTGQMVRRAIGQFVNEKSPDDMILLYFSGHGDKDSSNDQLFLCVQDTEKRYLTTTGIAASTIKDAMNTSYSKRQIIILDCCYSGDFTSLKGPPVSNERVATALQGRGRFVLTASSAGQTASEGGTGPDDLPNSIFTYYLIKGDQNG